MFLLISIKLAIEMGIFWPNDHAPKRESNFF